MSELRKPSRLPPYAFVCFAVMAGAQFLCYYTPRVFLPQLTLHVLTCPLDARIPFSPPWVIVYCLSFPFWICSGLWILCQEKAHTYRFTAAYVLAMLLSAAVFLLFPGTMDRPEITGCGFFDEWMRLIYRADSATNLFPSLHVLVSWFCWRGTLGCRGIPKWYKAFSFVFFVLVSFSVLLVKQHALIDIPGGIFFGELALQCAQLLRLERILFTIERQFLRSE